MTDAPVFPTKWHFVNATVLIGVDQGNGQFFGTTAPDGWPAVVVWTQDSLAARTVPANVDLRTIQVTALLRMLPEGLGVLVDPSSEGSMSVDPTYLATLKPLAHPFPPGLPTEFKDWVDLPPETVDKIRVEMADRDVHGVWALVYAVADSPYFGCLAYDVGGDSDAERSALDGLEAALEATTDLTRLDVLSVQMVGLEDLPDAVRSALPDGSRVYSRSA